MTMIAFDFDDLDDTASGALTPLALAGRHWQAVAEFNTAVALQTVRAFREAATLWTGGTSALWPDPADIRKGLASFSLTMPAMPTAGVPSVGVPSLTEPFAFSGPFAPEPRSAGEEDEIAEAELAGAGIAGPGIEGAATKPAVLEAPDGAPDDLTRISGVGPVLSRTLNGLGVFHFRQIAAWTPAEVAWVDATLKFKGRIDRDGWVAQAARLAEG